MSRQACWLCVTLVIVGVFSIACRATYLSEPPHEFYEYIENIPTPPLSIQLAEDTQRVVAPRDASCVSFVYTRLYGSNENYAFIRHEYEELLCSAMETCVVRPGDSEYVEFVTFVVNEMATIGLSSTTANASVASLYFNEEILIEAQETYETLFLLHIEHAYGCSPPPYSP